MENAGTSGRTGVKHLDILSPQAYPPESLFYNVLIGKQEVLAGTRSEEDHKINKEQRLFFSQVLHRAIRLSGVEKVQRDPRLGAAEREIARLCPSLDLSNADHLAQIRFHRQEQPISTRGRKKKLDLTSIEEMIQDDAAELHEWALVSIKFNDGDANSRGKGLVKGNVSIAGLPHTIIFLTRKSIENDKRLFFHYPHAPSDAVLANFQSDESPDGIYTCEAVNWKNVSEESLLAVPTNLLEFAA